MLEESRQKEAAAVEQVSALAASIRVDGEA